MRIITAPQQGTWTPLVHIKTWGYTKFNKVHGKCQLGKDKSPP